MPASADPRKAGSSFTLFPNTTFLKNLLLVRTSFEETHAHSMILDTHSSYWLSCDRLAPQLELNRP